MAGGFANAMKLVATSLALVLAPSVPMTPSSWMAANMVVPDGPRAGSRWDAGLTPYVAAIVDALDPDGPHNKVAVRKSAQTGLSVAGLGWVGYMIDRHPARMAYVLPTIDALNEFNREKLGPTIEQTPALNGIVRSQTSRSGEGSTSRSKRFPGGSLVLINANSAADLRARTLKTAVADEVDEWPDDLDKQGDPMTLLGARFTAFHATGDWKLLVISTPTLLGSSRIDAEFQGGDQRFWTMDCPGCAEPLRFEFRHLMFNKRPPYQAHYVTPCCGTVIEHGQKAALVRSGRFEPSNPEGLYPSFHIDALTSLLTTWDMIAEAFTKAKDDRLQLKGFFNTVLGLPFEERGDAPDHVRLMSRREDYPESRIPARGLIMTGGADVQHNGIWLTVKAFAPDKQSWTVTWRFLEGDTTDPARGAFASLLAVGEEKFPDAFGRSRIIDVTGVDSGDGGRANQVYAFCRAHPRFMAVKGVPGWTAPAIGTPSKVDVTVSGKKRRRGALLWPVGTWSLKAEVYSNLRKLGMRDGAEGIEQDPPGYMHFGKFLDEGYFRQLTAEYLSEERHRGRVRRVWRESGENHGLDCEVYARAVADWLGLSRFSPEQWAKLAADRGVPAEALDTDLFAPVNVAPAAPSAAASGRRFSKGI